MHGHDSDPDRTFDGEAWERHWRDAADAVEDAAPPNPYLAGETSGLTPGTALDAGCGTGSDALWLAARGWRVTGVDIAPTALARAAARAAGAALGGAVTWAEADLTTWQPAEPFDLVLTAYAHAAIPQLELYRRLSRWVAPGGSLLLVGHLHGGGDEEGGHGHGDRPPAETEVSAADIVTALGADWVVDTAEEHHRSHAEAAGRPFRLHDVVVRAHRRPAG